MKKLLDCEESRNYEKIQCTLDHFFQEARVKEFLDNSGAVIAYICELGNRHLSSHSMTKKQLAKHYGEVVKEFGSKILKSYLILYQKGPYSIDFEPNISELQKRGIISQISENQYVITEEGVHWLNNLLEDIKTYSRFLEIRDFILQNLYKTADQLSKEIFLGMDKFSYEERSIKQFKLVLIFDWSEFGTGELEPYHYSLLYSYERMKTYFEDIWGERRDGFFLNYDKIPEKVDFRSMKRLRRKFEKVNTSLREIMQKDDPAYLTEDKFECKNYIYNLWYVLEGVNIIHILEKICPSLHDIATICLLNYRYALENKGENETALKQMRDSQIKNEVRKLLDWGFLRKVRMRNRVGYMLTAKCFIDEASSYGVLSPEDLLKVIELHNKFTF